MIIINVMNKMCIFYEEIFGFVVIILLFEIEEEVVEVVNNCDVGLVLYFFIGNVSRVIWVFE